MKHPRWVRVNKLKKPFAEQLATMFGDYVRVDDLGDVIKVAAGEKVYFVDAHVPRLFALLPGANLSRMPAYLGGEIIFQDKAWCFLTYLFDVGSDDRDAIDACAAPGNKTTHLAALLVENKSEGKHQRAVAFERDKGRLGTLCKMVNLVGAGGIVSIKAGADFLAANPESDEFASVTALLLDPSCSGSGIVGRYDGWRMHLRVRCILRRTRGYGEGVAHRLPGNWDGGN